MNGESPPPPPPTSPIQAMFLLLCSRPAGLMGPADKGEVSRRQMKHVKVTPTSSFYFFLSTSPSSWLMEKILKAHYPLDYVACLLTYKRCGGIIIECARPIAV